MAYARRAARASVPLSGYGSAVLGVAAVTATCAPLKVHVATMTALAFLLVALLVAAAWGRRPALMAALLGALSFGVFFVAPPVPNAATARPDGPAPDLIARVALPR